MTAKKVISFFLVFLLTVSLLPPLPLAEAEEKTAKEANIRTFRERDGSIHTIYWTEGITPPEMTDDPALAGQKGYFELDETTPGFETYQAPIESGKGYFDLNKNSSRPEERNLCFLAAAENLLYWWMEQNKASIDRYLALLKEGQVYAQPQGLKPLLPFDEALWREIREEPALLHVQDVGFEQQLGINGLSKRVMTTYFAKQTGYWEDLPMDFFFNGYPDYVTGEQEENDPDRFEADVKGGYFYPIFGREKLTARYLDGASRKFSFYDRQMKAFLSQGKGICLSFFLGASKAHAITVWGAEYDSSDRLCRLYVTDSNDCYNTCLKQNDTARGIHSIQVGEAENGTMFLTSSTDPDNRKGAFVQGIVTLDLARELWAAKLQDLTPPEPAVIHRQPLSQTRPVGATPDVLSVSASVQGTGFLTYQWYESDRADLPGLPIPMATGSSYQPEKVRLGRHYYTCRITHHKNGKEAAADTSPACVEGEDVELVHAAKPVIRFDSKTETWNQFEAHEPLRVSAQSPDGGTLSYQWFQCTDSTGSSAWKLEGETAAAFQPPVNHPGRSFYFCAVTNENPTVNGDKRQTLRTGVKRLEIREASRPQMPQPPVITFVSADAVCFAGEQPPRFSVRAESPDGGTLRYQWARLEDGVRIPLEQAEENSYQPPVFQTAGRQQFVCTVWNFRADLNAASAPLESAVITLQVQARPQKPVITSQPEDGVYELGTIPNALKVEAESPDQSPLAYVWMEAETPEGPGKKLEGETANTLTLNLPHAPCVRYYYCVITAASGTETQSRRVKIQWTEKETPPEPPLPDKITSDRFTVSDGLLSKVKAGTTVEQLLDGIREGACLRVLKNGKEVPPEALVCTGMKLLLSDGEQVKDRLTVVVTGDTNGDGKISITDLIGLKAHLLGRETLTGVAAKAADTNADGRISITDFIQVKAFLLGKGTILPH